MELAAGATASARGLEQAGVGVALAAGVAVPWGPGDRLASFGAFVDAYPDARIANESITVTTFGARLPVGYRLTGSVLSPYLVVGPEVARRVVDGQRTRAGTLLGGYAAVGVEVAGPHRFFAEGGARAAIASGEDRDLSAATLLLTAGYRLGL